LDSKLVPAHISLGRALHDKGQLDEAIACFQKAIELDPNDANAHINLNALLVDVKRDYDGAISCCPKAIALDPKVAIAHNNLGSALLGKGQVEEAIACVQTAIALDPKCDLAHRQMGVILCDIKRDYDAAIACFRKVIELVPNDAKAHCN